MKTSFILFASLLVIVACSSNKNISHEQSCQDKYDAVSEKFEKGKYSAVKIPLNDLLSVCSGSKFIEEALYRLGEAHFNLKEWMEAQHEYSNFVRTFPASPLAENAQFRNAIASYHQIYSVGRDQKPTLEAIDYFEEFLKEYPASNLTDSANGYLAKLRTWLAKRELKIARLYKKMKEHQSAIIYYKSALNRYGDYVNKEDLHLKMAESYIHLHQYEQAQLHLDELKEVKKGEELYSKLEKVKKTLAQKQKEKKKSLKPVSEKNQQSL